MNFTDIQIYRTTKYKNTEQEQHLYLNFLEENILLMKYWENIRDLFSINLPAKFDLLGISKFNIKLGDFDGDPFLPASNDGIATFRRNDFCIKKFKTLTEQDKNLLSLFYIEDSLITTCKLYRLPNATIEKIQSICSLIKTKNFEHFRIHKKTSKWHKSRKYRAITHLHHKTNGINVTLEIIDNNGVSIIKENIIKNELWENVWFALFKGYWDGATYIIENRAGSEIYKTQYSL